MEPGLEAYSILRVQGPEILTLPTISLFCTEPSFFCSGVHLVLADMRSAEGWAE